MLMMRLLMRINHVLRMLHPMLSHLKIVRLLAMSSPPASPLSPWSLPSPQIPFPPLPSILSQPSPVLSPSPPPSPIRSLGYRAAMIRLRAEVTSTSHSPPLPSPFILSPTRSDAPSSGTPLLLPISASTSSPPLQLPSASRREDRPEVTLPPRKRLGMALSPGYEVGESSAAAAARPAGGLRADYGFVATMDRKIMRDPEREVGYEITDSWDEIVEALQGAPVSTDTELGGYMREFETRVRQDTDEIYMRIDDEQTERQLLAGRLNMLFKDRRAHAYTRHLMEIEARMSREAWVRSTDASDLVRGEANWYCFFVGINEDGDGEWCMVEMDGWSGRKRCRQAWREKGDTDNTITSESDSYYLSDLSRQFNILDRNRYPVDTSLIHIESRKSPTAELFDVDSGRIFIHHSLAPSQSALFPYLTLLLFSIIPRTSTLSR
nr:hypothetical protein [Tanacetum cinerariifolium]